MKITAGLGSVDEYIRFVEAGADECFCGYVPYSWTAKYGTQVPLNRREVLCCNVQIGAYSELEILAGMVRRYGKPVHLTFNSLYYLPKQYPEIAKIIVSCMQLGFQSFILADPALIVYLREQGIDCEIHLSGEMGEINTGSVRVLSRLGLTRIIFHRKNTFADMRAVTKLADLTSNLTFPAFPTEFEAFVMNENCQFTGAFCNSLHGDELGHLCRVPYWLAPVCGRKVEESGWNQLRENGLIDEDGELIGAERLKNENENENQSRNQNGNEDNEDEEAIEDGYLCGESGCGLCALWQLRRAGITHLKLVGRGNYVDFMERDIRNLSRAREILENSVSEEEFQRRIRKELFPDGCSGNCYYH
ncbi:U32 family peptidase [Brotaphodocola sp.]|uniref:U32 family peptidase n=1 Tax=Brotaphodocola sp. TaxID=3073577 RepID=UPI003D7D2027